MSFQKSQQVHSDNLQEMERLNSDLQNAVIKNTKKQLANDDKNFTGNLSESVGKGPINESGFFTVVVDSPYGVPVEFGMPPGIHVNFDELRKWVEGKLGVSVTESKNVTFKIWRKILDKGIPQSRFFKKGIKMTISNHGILNLRTSRPPPDMTVRKIRKFSRTVKRATKYINKFNKIRRKIRS